MNVVAMSDVPISILEIPKSPIFIMLFFKNMFLNQENRCLLKSF